MTSSQKASAVRRKRAASNTGPKPTNVATFTKRKKAMGGGMMTMPRATYKGGGACIKGKGKAYGKNS